MVYLLYKQRRHFIYTYQSTILYLYVLLLACMTEYFPTYSPECFSCMPNYCLHATSLPASLRIAWMPKCLLTCLFVACSLKACLLAWMFASLKPCFMSECLPPCLNVAFSPRMFASLAFMYQFFVWMSDCLKVFNHAWNLPACLVNFYTIIMFVNSNCKKVIYLQWSFATGKQNSLLISCFGRFPSKFGLLLQLQFVAD